MNIVSSLVTTVTLMKDVTETVRNTCTLSINVAVAPYQ